MNKRTANRVMLAAFAAITAIGLANASPAEGATANRVTRAYPELTHCYVDDNGIPSASFRLTNQTSRTLGFTLVRVTFTDGSGKMLDQATTYVWNLAPRHVYQDTGFGSFKPVKGMRCKITAL